jgi:hypothetical protein
MADFRFNVSDSYDIPRRGWMLRLKLTDGDFKPSMLKPGSAFRIVTPEGDSWETSVKGLPSTAGRQTQQRVDTYREFDVVIPAEDAVRDGREVEIGWTVVPS